MLPIERAVPSLLVVDVAVCVAAPGAAAEVAAGPPVRLSLTERRSTRSSRAWASMAASRSAISLTARSRSAVGNQSEAVVGPTGADDCGVDRRLTSKSLCVYILDLRLKAVVLLLCLVRLRLYRSETLLLLLELALQALVLHHCSMSSTGSDAEARGQGGQWGGGWSVQRVCAYVGAGAGGAGCGTRVVRPSRETGWRACNGDPANMSASRWSTVLQNLRARVRHSTPHCCMSCTPCATS